MYVVMTMVQATMTLLDELLQALQADVWSSLMASEFYCDGRWIVSYSCLHIAMD